MSTLRWGWILVLIVVVGLVAAAAVAARPQQLVYPCNPRFNRTAGPRIVSVDSGVVDVRVDVNYQCATGKRRADFFLLVENTVNTQPEGRRGRQLVANIREGLTAFVQNMDYSNGTRGGMILYNSNVLVNSELQGGEGGKRALIAAIGRFGTTPNPSARALGGAIDKATELLSAAEAPTDTMKLILILDTGAPFTGAERDVNAACRDARSAGVTIAVFALEDPAGRLSSCADVERSSQRDNGEDIPDRLGAMADSLVGGEQLEKLRLTDGLHERFEYVVGSASPKAPERFLNEIAWDILPPAPPEGHVFTYKVRVKRGAEPGIVPLAREFSLGLYYKSGDFFELRQPSPLICIHPPNDPAFCDEFAGTLTPPAPTATVTATAPPTGSPAPTDEPSVTPSPEPGATATTPATPADKAQRLHLPCLLANYAFEG